MLYVYNCRCSAFSMVYIRTANSSVQSFAPRMDFATIHSHDFRRVRIRAMLKASVAKPSLIFNNNTKSWYYIKSGHNCTIADGNPYIPAARWSTISVNEISYYIKYFEPFTCYTTFSCQIPSMRWPNRMLLSCIMMIRCFRLYVCGFYFLTII